MTLNPYQNDLLSSYLEKSARRIPPTRPLPSVVPIGNGRDFRISGSRTQGPMRPLAVAPTKTAPPPPTRTTGLSSSGDGPYPLAIRRNNGTPKVSGRDAAAFYRNLVNGGKPHLGDVDIRNIQDYVGNNMHKLDEGVWIGDTYFAGRNNISHNKPRPKGPVVDAEVVGGPKPPRAGGGNGGQPPVPPTSLGTAGIPGGGKGSGMPGGKDGRPWYKNPWVIGGTAAAATAGTGALLYNYASNKAKETTDAAPAPSGTPSNNSTTTTPTPNESPESESWWDSILEWVQENPELAMLLLAGGGFAGGALLAR